MIHKVLKGLAPVAALAASAMLAGCNVDMQIGDKEGVPLAELDMDGAEPTDVALAALVAAALIGPMGAIIVGPLSSHGRCRGRPRRPPWRR